MTRIIEGVRIGATAKLGPGCSAAIFDPTHTQIVLIRRTDNGRWCLPGGHMEAGESVTEACLREVWEETGLRVVLSALVGVYSNPHRVIEYADGNRYHIVTLHFAALPDSGTLTLGDETADIDYFSAAATAALDVMEHHRERIADSFTGQSLPFIR